MLKHGKKQFKTGTKVNEATSTIFCGHKKFKPGYSYMILLTKRISYILTRQKKIRFGQPIFLTRPLFGGWCYLSTIINRYAKKIIAWNLGKRMTEELLQKI